VGRFLVGEAGDIDGDEDVAEIVRKRRDCGVELAGFQRCVRLARVRVGDEVELVGKRTRTEAAALRSFLGQERVTERTQEVTEVVLVPQQPRAGEHTRVGLLDEVICVLTGA
jgi:hypothetical protein